MITPGLLIIGCAVSTAGNPVLFNDNQYLLRHKGAVLMIHNFGIPSHAPDDLPNLVQDVNFIPEDDGTFRPQDSVHLQKDVFQIAPA